MTIGKKLAISIGAVFGLFAVTFMFFQHHREKEYKIECLNIRLQDYNRIVSESVGSREAVADTAAVAEFVRRHAVPNLRVTLIDSLGRVIFDNCESNYQQMENHLQRKEIRDALKNGQGADFDRVSSTLGEEYFYSATYIPRLGIFVRSALPYNHDLKDSLQVEMKYIWLTLLVTIVLSLVLYRFAGRLGKNIAKLRTFADRIAVGESLDIEELVRFPDDELGDIAERIIKIHRNLLSSREEQDRMKRQLTQNAAHELKTPVASIQGYLETILTDPEISDETRQQFLVQCFEQTKRLTSILQDISTLNKIDEASVVYEFATVDVSQVVGRIVESSALQLKERNMVFDNRLPEPLMVSGNASLLDSIFRNLTDNALSYAGAGTTVTLTAEPADDGWQFTFSDNGVGIPAEHIARIFERFYRVDKGRSRRLGGTGLGLAIVKNAVMLHGGTITATPNPDGGVRFVFTISAKKRQS